MITTIAIQELQYLLRQKRLWLLLGIFTSFTLWLYHRGTVFVGILAEGEPVNSPHAITRNAIFFSILGLAVLFPVFNGAALREHQCGFTEVLFSTPIRKVDFYLGRFAAGVTLCSFLAGWLLACNFFGVKMGLLAGVIHPEEVVAFRPAVFTKAFFYYLLPSMLLSGSVVFSVAVMSRKTLYGLLSLLCLLLFFLLSDTFASNMENQWLAALADPFGQKAVEMEFRYLSTMERSHTGLSLTPHLLANRFLWGGAGLLLLVFGYTHFRREDYRKKPAKTEIAERKTALPVFGGEISGVNPVFGLPTHWLQFTTLFRRALWNLLGSLPFLILLLALAGFLGTDLFHRYEQYGLQALPLTYEMIEMVGSYQPLLVVAMLFFTGELAWKERDAGLAGIIDATPHSTLSSVMAKAFAGTAALLLAYGFWLSCLAGWQLWQGYCCIAWAQYVVELFIRVLPVFFFWLCFFLFLQAVLNQKYAAYVLSAAALIGQSLLWRYLDWESNLIRLGKTGEVVVSDFNGFQPFLSANNWFGLYWVLAGGLLLWASVLFWGRGVDKSLAIRFRSGRVQMGRVAWSAGALLLLTWLAVGSIIFYNTRVLNTYTTQIEKLDIKAEYEKLYKQYESIEHPHIVQARFFIDLFPGPRRLETQTELILANNSCEEIDSLHFSTRSVYNNNGWALKMEIPFSRLVLKDEQHGYLIYQLQNSLKPGDSLTLRIRSDYTPRGFENEVANTDIVPNGSFFNIWEFLPHQGYVPAHEIREEEEREERGLSAEQIPGDSTARRFQNYLYPYAGWIDMETYISTSVEQIAVAPGSLVKEWREGGRRYFHYRLDQPGLFFMSFASGRYEVARRQWKGINLEVYHHPDHGQNVETMLDAMQLSLAYCIGHFGLYPHRQARIIEFPRYAAYAAAFPGAIPFSEEKGFVLNYEPGRDNNSILSSVAHEIAHQWWGHQAMPADLPGKSMLTESFAEYTSLMVMKQQASEKQMRDFLRYDYDEYLKWRPQVKEEEPLWRADEQPMVYYRKGSVVFYTLQELVGEERVNRSLRRYMEAYRHATSPYPRSEDYLEFLKEELPDSLEHLAEELFMKDGPLKESLLLWEQE